MMKLRKKPFSHAGAHTVTATAVCAIMDSRFFAISTNLQHPMLQVIALFGLNGGKESTVSKTNGQNERGR